MLEHSTPPTSSRRAAALLVAILSVSACGPGDKVAADTAAASTAATPSSSDPASAGSAGSMTGMKGDSMQGMSGMAMTGDPDRDFLRMMSDHHKGLIEMVHMTMEGKEGGSAVADAKQLDTKQDRELDEMMTMLEKTYKDPYTPKVIPDHQAMIDELKRTKGSAYARTFYQNLVTHHQQAIKMVDAYLPTAKSATVKQMAETMKSDQTKEIAEFQKKLGDIK